MSAYSLEKFNSVSELQLHAARSYLCRLPATSRVDSQRQLQPTGSEASCSSKGSLKRPNKHSEGGRPCFDKPNRPFVAASGSEGHGHGNSSLGQKRKLPPHEQNQKGFLDIKAKQTLSQAEFHQRIKYGSCINCSE